MGRKDDNSINYPHNFNPFHNTRNTRVITQEFTTGSKIDPG